MEPIFGPHIRAFAATSHRLGYIDGRQCRTRWRAKGPVLRCTKTGSPRRYFRLIGRIMMRRRNNRALNTVFYSSKKYRRRLVNWRVNLGNVTMSDIEAKPIKILTREAIGKLTRIVFDLTDYAKNFFYSRF